MQYLGFFLLQQAAPTAQSNPLVSFLPLIAIVAIFYFLVFMPMQKQKKQQAAMLSNLQTGTDVLTTGGIVGTIISLTDTTLVLRVKPDNIKLQVMRSAVASLIDPAKPAIEEKK
jgi:preprotein translocase subunit YajC